MRELEPAGRDDGVVADHAEREGEHVAHEHAEQERAELEDALAEVGEVHARHERYECDEPVLRAAERGRAGAAGHVAHGDGVERDADAQDDGAGDDAGKQRLDLAEAQREHDRDGAADDLCSEDGADAELDADGGERGHVRERRAHDHGQARAEAAAEQRMRLYERDQAGHHEGHLDEQGLLVCRQVAQVCHDDCGRDDAHDRSDHVLQRHRDEFLRRELSVSNKQCG